MPLQSLIFLIGLGILYLGAEWLVKGAAGLALRYGIRPLVVGLTVVALGTSMPEFLVNVFAALSDGDSLAMGNIIGSNICNIALILGTSAVVLPLAVTSGTLRKEYPIMMLVMVFFYAISLDGVIDKLDGLMLVAGLVAFLVFIVLDARRYARRASLNEGAGVDEEEPAVSVWRKVGYLAGGVILLAIGAHLMVQAAVNIADRLGIDQIVVGLTVVAVGTSLPELAASVVSAIKSEADLSVGNVLGSNLLNVLFVVGLVAMIKPLDVEPESLGIHFPVMLGFSVLLFPIMWTQSRISRVEGGFLLTGFVVYLAYLVIPYF